MEILRQVGLEDARAREVAARRISPTAGSSRSSRSPARELATYVKELNEGVEGFSPTRARVHQPGRARADAARARRGARRDVRNRTEAVAFEQDDDGVTGDAARPRLAARSATVRARYMVAADGNRSPMRERLGIAMRGHGELSRSITIYFRADCTAAAARPQPGRDLRPQPRAARLLPARPRRRQPGFLVDQHASATDVTHGRGGQRAGDGMTEERALELVRTAIGAPDMPMEIVDVATGGPRRTAPSGSATAACSSPATPRTSCRRTAASAATPASRTRTTSPGSSPRSSRARPAPALLDTYEAERRPLGRADRRAGLHALRHAGRARARHRRRRARRSPT